MADRRQRGHVPVALRLGDDRVLHPVHGGVQMAAMHEERRQLGVARRAPQVHHHVLGDARRQRLAAFLGDQVQREVDARGDAGAGRDRPVDDEHAVVDHLRLGRQGAQLRQQLVVRGAAAVREQAGARREQRARADRDQAMRRFGGEQRLAELLA